jgi:hypothetical protein
MTLVWTRIGKVAIIVALSAIGAFSCGSSGPSTDAGGSGGSEGRRDAAVEKSTGSCTGNCNCSCSGGQLVTGLIGGACTCDEACSRAGAGNSGTGTCS